MGDGRPPERLLGCGTLRIAVVSFEFGVDSGPEGICTERLVAALETAGAEVTVVTRVCEAASADRRTGIVAMTSRFERPTRPQAVLGTMLVGGWSSHWWWVRAVAAATVQADFVYARGNPLSSLLAGQGLARRLDVPFVAHFSDPIPSPWDEVGPVRSMVTRAVRRVVDSASWVTFSTPEGADYQGEALGRDLRRKSLVVRNIVPDWNIRWRLRTHQAFTLLYAGGFGGRRQPDSLGRGLVRAAETCGRAFRVRFVGTGVPAVGRIRGIVGTRISVEHVPRLPDLSREYEAADVVLSVDADDLKPVFLATKTTEALHAGRRVLIVTPPGSPAHRLFAGRWASVRVAPHDPEAIGRALLDLLDVPDSTADCEIRDRRAALAEFRAPSVARMFVNALGSLGAVSRV